MAIPDHPTLIPQVLPTKEQDCPPEDIQALLKKPSNVKGFQHISIAELIEAYKLVLLSISWVTDTGY